MLRFLRVRNFALIDQIEIHFESGFALLSGETGAGKSIVVDALGLLAGAKASADMIRTGESRAVIEAVFESDIKVQLERLGLDSDGGDVIVRREIAADERNRVYINSQPSTVSVLRDLAPALLDIHGQHEQQSLLDNASQLALVDAFAETTRVAETVRQLYSECQRLENEIAELIAEQSRRNERLDLLQFQHDEIMKSNPKPGETEQVRQHVEVLSHTGKLLDAAIRGYQNLYESESSALSLLAQTLRFLRDASQHDAKLLPVVEQLETTQIAVQDTAHALRDYADHIDTDPQELERVQARLAELERLHRKYGPDVIDHLNKLRRDIDSMGLTENKKDDLSKKLEGLRKEYEAMATVLSRRRRTAAKTLEAAAERELQSLAMPQARFVVDWSEVRPGSSAGFDRPEFLISANPGEEPMPLRRIASGGELSRIMLALRTVLATDGAQKTLVFDEVDAGIGGKAAETVGKKLQELSSRYQILCVTHLAQIAAFAHHQYRIEKRVVNGRTVTRIEPMTGDARVDELARMMSGSRVTETARRHIKELLAGAGQS